MMQLWKRFLQLGGRHRRWLTEDTAFELDEAVREYLAALPCPVCAYLSPRHMLSLVPAQPQSAVAIWRGAVQAGMIPRSVLFEVFKEALMLLSPFILSIRTPMLNKGEEDAVVAWQPWVSREWRTFNFEKSISKMEQSALQVELCNVVPTYFVASSLVCEQIRFRKFRTLGLEALEWEKLSSPLLKVLLEWSDDHHMIRLSSKVAACGAADTLYSLKTQPEMFHQALNALALILPTFMVPEEQVRHVYKEQLAGTNSIYRGEFGPEFIARFPESCALTDHPEMQFAVQRDGNGCLMLCPNFLHANRGALNSFYQTFFSVCNGFTIVGGQNYQHNDHVHEHQSQNVRHFFQASLPYNSRVGDEVTFCQIPKAGILGLHYVLENDRDRFALTIATVDGNVFSFDGSVSSFRYLSSTGIPNGGLPLEVVKALASSQVVKVIAVDSTGEGEWVSEDRRVVSHLRNYLNVNVETVCSLWKWAMFVGFPISSPLMTSVAFYRRLLARLGVAITPCTPTALLVALCASRLLSVHETDGYHLDTATLGQMLMDNDMKSWQRRNLELRIRRYGAEFCSKSGQTQSLERFLHHLSSFYGPEVCVLEKQTEPTFIASSLGNASFGVQQTSEEETERRKKEDAKEKDNDEEEYLDALCAAPDGAAFVDHEGLQTETEEKRQSTAEAETTVLQDRKPMGANNGLNVMLGEDNVSVEETPLTAMTFLKATPMVKGNFFHSDKNGNGGDNDECSELLCGKSRFLLPLPNFPLSGKKDVRFNGYGPRPLPPPFSTLSTTIPGRSNCNNVFKNGPCTSLEGARSEALNNRIVKGIGPEREIIDRLTREIIQESQRQPAKCPTRKDNVVNDAVHEVLVELLRNMLRTITKK